MTITTTKMIQHIVTHPGQPHRDDFMACSIALSVYGPVPIFRRDPTQEELENPEVLVLDVGEKHEPEKLNFDHHQLPRDHEPECALSLLLRYLDMEQYFTNLKTYHVLVMTDSKGPFYTAQKLELPRFPFELTSPIESALLDAFQDREELRCDHWLHTALTELGNRHIEYAKTKTEQLDKLRTLIRTQVIESNGKAVQALIVESKEIDGLQDIRDADYPEAGVSICHDDRGNGWTLYRFNDHPDIDFAQVKDDPAVLFAHAGGFIAKTHEMLPISDVMALCQKSVVG